MKLHFIEVTSTAGNWGKFAVGQYSPEEWATPSMVGPVSDHRPLLAQIGNVLFKGLWVLDLQTGEAGFFLPGGYAKADLDKHRIWVCPLFEPFLTWLYTWLDEREPDVDLDALPRSLHVDGVPQQLHGYRRAGPAAT